MNFDAIPDELKQLNQWIVWRPVDLGTGRVQKLPFNAYNPYVAAKTNDPSSWADFETAVNAIRRDSRLGGLGFVFTPGDPYVGIDIDDKEKVDPALAEKRAEVVKDILTSTKSYMERSPSGHGVHIIARGNLPSSALVVRAFQLEIYASLRFFTMTGDIIDGRNTITVEQAILNDLVEAFPKSDRTDYEMATLSDTETFGRRLDLTHTEVLAIAWRQPGFAERWNGLHSDWSLEHKRLIGDLDKITGRVEQVRELIHGSPLVLNTPPKNGVSRLTKSQRLFYDLLGEVREAFEGNGHQAWYTLAPAYIEHGRQLAEVLLADFARQRELEAQRQAEILEQLRTTGVQSRDSEGLLERFAEVVGPENLIVSRPPGLVGEFVRNTELGSWYPYTTYATPATLAILSGLLGRRYKISRSGLNLNFILAAYSGTGKSDHAKAWQRFVNRATERLLVANHLMQPKTRVINGSTSSIQGFVDQLHDTWSATWIVDEAYSMVKSMMDERNATGTQLRNSFNEIYDASDRDGVFRPPASRANAKANAQTLVRNFNLSSFWTMTPEELDSFTGSVTNGFMSRMVVIRENKAFGQRQDTPALDLPQHLQQALDTLMAQSNQFDAEFDADPIKGAGLIYNVDLDAEAIELRGRIQTLIDQTMRDAIAGKIPKDYLLVNRLVVNALKIGATLAAVQSPFNPVVTGQQLRWAFGYVAQHMIGFLSDIDRGEIGEQASDDVKAIIRKYKEMSRKPEHKGARGIARNELRDVCKRIKPFVDAKGGLASPSEMVTKAFKHMLDEGVFEEVDAPTNKPGRPPKLLCATDDPIWR